MFVSVNTELTNSVWVPSPETCDASSSSNTGVHDKFTFPLRSAWEPISAILHKIRAQCACLLLQQLYTLYINALVSSHPHMLLSTYQSACKLCSCQQRGAATLSQVQANLIIAHHIPRKITTSRPTTLHVTHSLHYTQSGQESHMHMVTSTLHINFLFHMPWNFT